jgi:hypothetical protein
VVRADKAGLYSALLNYVGQVGELARFDLVPGVREVVGMKQVRLDLPELGMIIATRAMLGAGIALLLADRFTRDQRRAVGATLTIIGLVTTIPAIWTVCGNAEEKASVPLA